MLSPMVSEWGQRCRLCFHYQLICLTKPDILEQFSQLPASQDDYSLVHRDVYPTNFYVNHEKITLFDFDDCLYIKDILFNFDFRDTYKYLD